MRVVLFKIKENVKMQQMPRLIVKQLQNAIY